MVSTYFLVDTCMHPNAEPRARRIHGAEIKAKVLAECRQPGASVSAVALAHGLNANLVRKWLHGRGLRRVGLQAEAAEPSKEAGVVQAAMPGSAHDQGEPGLRFVPVELAATSGPIGEASAPWRGGEPAQHEEAAIHIELRRGGGQMAVKWPAAQAGECAMWLRDLAAAMLE